MASNPEYNLDTELKELEKRLQAKKLSDGAAQVGYLQYFMSLGTIVGNPYGADVKIGEETVSLDIVEADSAIVVEEKAKAFAERIRSLLEMLPTPVLPEPPLSPSERELSPELKEFKEGFEKSVDIWRQAGLFTPERAKNYTAPEFARDYQQLLTPEILAMTQPGTELNRGYRTPIWAPMDVPLYDEKPETLTYLKLLKEALWEGFCGTAGGKQRNTLFIGPEKRVIKPDNVTVANILFRWDRYLKAGVVHNVQKLDKDNHGGVSEEKLLESLQGVEKRTGGVMRLERDQLIMPADIGETAMSALDWEAKLPTVLPPHATIQDIKQAIAHIVYCLKTQGWIPDYYDWQSEQTSRVNLALKTFIPDEGPSGAVAVAIWNVASRRFRLDRSLAVSQGSGRGVRGGVRIK